MKKLFTLFLSVLFIQTVFAQDKTSIFNFKTVGVAFRPVALTNVSDVNYFGCDVKFQMYKEISSWYNIGLSSTPLSFERTEYTISSNAIVEYDPRFVDGYDTWNHSVGISNKFLFGMYKGGQLPFYIDANLMYTLNSYKVNKAYDVQTNRFETSTGGFEWNSMVGYELTFGYKYIYIQYVYKESIPDSGLFNGMSSLGMGLKYTF